VLVASSTSLGAVSEFFYGDTLQAVRAAHAAETAHGEHHGEHIEPEEDMGMDGVRLQTNMAMVKMDENGP
jgi:hypothetical protein